MAIELTTPWGTFKYTKPLALGIASILFVTGANLLNGNLPVLILTYLVTKNQSTFCNTPWYITLLGFVVMSCGALLFYLLIINWKKEFYREVFYEVQSAVHELFSAMNIRLNSTDTELLQEHHKLCYAAYRKALAFVHEHATTLDDTTEEYCLTILYNLGKQIIDLDGHIKGIQSRQDGTSHYDAHLANQGLQNSLEPIKEKFNELKLILRRKDKFRLV